MTQCTGQEVAQGKKAEIYLQRVSLGWSAKYMCVRRQLKARDETAVRVREYCRSLTQGQEQLFSPPDRLEKILNSWSIGKHTKEGGLASGAGKN